MTKTIFDSLFDFMFQKESLDDEVSAVAEQESVYSDEDLAEVRAFNEFLKKNKEGMRKLVGPMPKPLPDIEPDYDI